MKMIFEKIKGACYLYTETDAHFEKVQSSRSSPLISSDILNNQCDLSHYSDFHMAFDIHNPIKKIKLSASAKRTESKSRKNKIN